MNNFEYVILDLIESTTKNFKSQPMNLGGLPGSGGGIGAPPGGYIGWLPQTRVAYDDDEIASSGITNSGTLLDNLNHIRYRLHILESGSSTLVIDELDGVPTVSGVDYITFSGGAIVTDLGGGHIVVGITASGGGGINAPHSPGGYLSLVDHVLVPTTDQTGRAHIYWNPNDEGGLVPLYNGSSSWTMELVTQLDLTLDSNSGHTGYHQINKGFDLWLYKDGSTWRLVSGPVWTNLTTPSQIGRFVNGIEVNDASFTGRYGSASGDTVTVPAAMGVYVGSFLTTADGQTETSRTKRFLWNRYHRKALPMIFTSSGNWTQDATSGVRQRNGDAASKVEIFIGRVLDTIDFALVTSCTSTNSAYGVAGIGEDSTSAFHADAHQQGGGFSNSVGWFPFSSTLTCYPSSVGYHYYAWLEWASAATITWYAGSSPGYYRGGISGFIFG